MAEGDPSPLRNLERRRGVFRRMHGFVLEVLLDRHGVTSDRLEPLSSHLLPLVDEFCARAIRAGWRSRRLTQLKEKFGTLRVHVSTEGESEAFVSWARCCAAELRDRS